MPIGPSFVSGPQDPLHDGSPNYVPTSVSGRRMALYDWFPIGPPVVAGRRMAFRECFPIGPMICFWEQDGFAGVVSHRTVHLFPAAGWLSRHGFSDIGSFIFVSGLRMACQDGFP